MLLLYHFLKSWGEIYHIPDNIYRLSLYIITGNRQWNSLFYKHPVQNDSLKINQVIKNPRPHGRGFLFRRVRFAFIIWFHPRVYTRGFCHLGINKDYHGGKIGYYLNRRFDEPFPKYEISYMEPTWDFIIEDTEYIVISSAGISLTLQQFKQCQYIFYQQIGTYSIYKVKCFK